MGGWKTHDGLMIPTGKSKHRDSIVINKDGIKIRTVSPQEAAIIRAHNPIEIWQIASQKEV
jgi:hypothetical protein